MLATFIKTLLALVCFSLYGCYSYRIFPKEDRNFVPPDPTRSAWIVNPELKKEAEILKGAGIYVLANSPNEADCNILLQPLDKMFICGNGLIVHAVLLGQVPLTLTDRYYFSYQEINGKDSVTHNFDLKVAQRYWFWDMFIFRKRLPEKLSHSLAANYYRSHQTITRARR